MRTTWWGFETRERVLFPGDGCLQPLSRGSPLRPRRRGGYLARSADTTAVFADLALWWTKWADMRNYCARLDLLRTSSPSNGVPDARLGHHRRRQDHAKGEGGLLYGSSVAERGTNDAKFKASDVMADETA